MHLSHRHVSSCGTVLHLSHRGNLELQPAFRPFGKAVSWSSRIPLAYVLVLFAGGYRLLGIRLVQVQPYQAYALDAMINSFMADSALSFRPSAVAPASSALAHRCFWGLSYSPQFSHRFVNFWPDTIDMQTLSMRCYSSILQL